MLEFSDQLPPCIAFKCGVCGYTWVMTFKAKDNENERLWLAGQSLNIGCGGRWNLTRFKEKIEDGTFHEDKMGPLPDPACVTCPGSMMPMAVTPELIAAFYVGGELAAELLEMGRKP